VVKCSDNPKEGTASFFRVICREILDKKLRSTNFSRSPLEKSDKELFFKSQFYNLFPSSVAVTGAKLSKMFYQYPTGSFSSN
jgi:hypothetical protein